MTKCMAWRKFFTAHVRSNRNNFIWCFSQGSSTKEQCWKLYALDFKKPRIHQCVWVKVKSMALSWIHFWLLDTGRYDSTSGRSLCVREAAGWSWMDDASVCSVLRCVDQLGAQLRSISWLCAWEICEDTGRGSEPMTVETWRTKTFATRSLWVKQHACTVSKAPATNRKNWVVQKFIWRNMCLEGGIRQVRLCWTRCVRPGGRRSGAGIPGTYMIYVNILTSGGGTFGSFSEISAPLRCSLDG
jgi:hypothetical protein